jgi:hypothetical protein
MDSTHLLLQANNLRTLSSNRTPAFVAAVSEVHPAETSPADS